MPRLAERHSHKPRQGCNEPVTGVAGGRTVLECSGNDANGDPYHADCVATQELRDAFADEQADRATTCGMDANANEDFCALAIVANPCIRDPFGKDAGGTADCNKDTYAIARSNRLGYCGRPSAGVINPLCTNARLGLCNGDDDKDEPFALACGTENHAAQLTWCSRGANSGKAECLKPHTGSCSARPFGDAVKNYNGVPVNCLTHETDGVLTYVTHRQSLCAEGAEVATALNCDTATIAPFVCGMDMNANYNPFAAFCLESANAGKSKDEILMARQTVLTQCTDTNNDADLVCVNAAKDIRELNTACGDGATSLEARCDFTEYEGTQQAFCAGETSVNIFNADCENGKHGNVTLARETECRRTTATPNVIDRATECPTIRARLCTADEFELNSDNGYLCGDEDLQGTNYETTREATCATRLTTGDDVANCTLFLDTLCEGKEFGTAGTGDYYSCAGDTTLNSKRETLCGADGTGSGTLTDGECTATITRICVDDKLLSDSVGDGGYDCAGNETPAVLSARRAHCATDQVTTAGCPDVLTTLCTGANSFLDMAPTGAGTTFNCADAAYLPQRREHCATGSNDDASVDCRAVITTLCETGTSVEAEVATGVDGKSYNCSTSTVPDVITARETHCRISGNAGGLCTDTISRLCGVDPFESETGGVSASLCQDGDGQVTYELARERKCFPRPTDGETNFDNCNTFLTKICTGKEFGTAGVVGGYDCAADGKFDSARETRCGADGDLDKDGTLNDSDCTATITRICVDAELLSGSVGAGGYNCADNETTAVLNARRAHCATPQVTTEGCPAVLTTLCMGANSLLDKAPTGIEGTTFDCADGDTYKDAKEIHCDANPTATGCPVFLTNLCLGENSVKTEVGAGNYDCAGDGNQLTERQDFCREDDNSDGLCTTTIVGLCTADEFEQRVDKTYVCGDEEIDGTNYADMRKETCRTALSEDKCKPTIQGFCGESNDNPTTINNLFDPLCGSGYDGARDEACLANNSVTAGDE